MTFIAEVRDDTPHEECLRIAADFIEHQDPYALSTVRDLDIQYSTKRDRGGSVEVDVAVEGFGLIQ